MANKTEKSKPISWGAAAPPTPFRKLFRNLGELAFTFSDLEQQLNETIQVMLGTSWQEAAAMEDLMQNTSSRIELFYILAISGTALNPLYKLTKGPTPPDQIAKRELREMAKKIYGDLQQANGDRNNLFHGPWTGLTFNSPDSTFSKDRLKAQAGKLTEIPVRGISVKLLKEQARFFISLRLRLADWGARYRRKERPEFWPGPLPEKYLLRSPLGRLIHENRSAAEKVQRPPLLP